MREKLRASCERVKRCYGKDYRFVMANTASAPLGSGIARGSGEKTAIRGRAIGPSRRAVNRGAYRCAQWRMRSFPRRLGQVLREIQPCLAATDDVEVAVGVVILDVD